MTLVMTTSSDNLQFLQRKNHSINTLLKTHSLKALFFLILGLRIFFQNIKVGGGKKIKIKITKKFFLFNLKHIWIGGKKIKKIV